MRFTELLEWYFLWPFKGAKYFKKNYTSSQIKAGLIGLIVLFVVTIPSLLLFQQCSVKTSENAFENYREACRAADFETAHKYLDKLKEKAYDWESEQKAQEAEEYIYRQEALYLMSQNDDAAKKRLIYLIKEEKRGNELIKIIIDLAMEEKDESFVKMLANQLEVRDEDEGYVGKVKKEIYGDNNDDVVILNKVASFLLSSDAKDNIDFVLTLFEKHKKEDVFLKNSISKLRIERGNTELTNKVFGLLGVIENRIPNRPPINGYIKSNHDGYVDKPYKDFMEQTKIYNDACKSIIEVAILSQNRELAEKALSKVKSNISYNEIGPWEQVVNKTSYSSLYNAFKFYIDSEDIKNAKAVYQQAVRSGAFK